MLLIEKLLISPLYLLGVLLLTVFVGWLLAIKIFAPRDKFWRIANLCGLLFTCLGIFVSLKIADRYSMNENIIGTKCE